jgi:hypothetical protein
MQEFPLHGVLFTESIRLVRPVSSAVAPVLRTVRLKIDRHFWGENRVAPKRCFGANATGNSRVFHRFQNRKISRIRRRPGDFDHGIIGFLPADECAGGRDEEELECKDRKPVVLKNNENHPAPDDGRYSEYDKGSELSRNRHVA